MRYLFLCAGLAMITGSAAPATAEQPSSIADIERDAGEKARQSAQANAALAAARDDALKASIAEPAVVEMISRAAVAAAAESQKQKEKEAETRSFAGLKFGVGVAGTFDLGRHDRVLDANVVNGIVRIKESNNTRARVMLESHIFIWPRGTGRRSRKVGDRAVHWLAARYG